MQKSFMRIPYTGPLPPARIIPSDANDPIRAISALSTFLTSPRGTRPPSTVVLSGAGISVASGLADYRGKNGTYVQNATYRPIYYHEFVASHAARQRYWARSFLGFPSLHHARPNPAHHAVAALGRLGIINNVITQNVDSFHPQSHPSLPTLELHGYLRSLVCLTCRQEFSRTTFQTDLARLNPPWAELLAQAVASGALTTENPAERARRGIKTNPDGDVDLPGVEYETFRYPACPTCLKDRSVEVQVDRDGAVMAGAKGGVLKPAVVMFGESIPGQVKVAAEQMVDAADRILVLGTSLATYSAWRLVKRAKERGMGIGVVNLGGVRGEADLFDDASTLAEIVRLERALSEVLVGVVKTLGGQASIELGEQNMVETQVAELVSGGRLE